MKTRCKFVCESYEKRDDDSATVSFRAVIDDTEENKSFFLFSSLPRWIKKSPCK